MCTSRFPVRVLPRSLSATEQERTQMVPAMPTTMKGQSGAPHRIYIRTQRQRDSLCSFGHPLVGSLCDGRQRLQLLQLGATRTKRLAQGGGRRSRELRQACLAGTAPPGAFWLVSIDQRLCKLFRALEAQ